MRTPDARIRSIDALRGIAATLVLLFHYTFWYGQPGGAIGWPLFSFGHYGVELFFVLSGFLIFMTLERTGRVYDFAVSRVARLYPAYIAAVLLSATVGAFHQRMPFPPVTARLVTVNLSMIQNFLGSPSLDSSYWTLAYELVFYILMALVFWRGLASRIEVCCLVWLGWAFVGAATGLQLSVPLQLLTLQFYGQFFIIGIALYRIHKGQGRPLTWVVLAAAILLSAFVSGPRTLTTDWRLYVLVTLVCTVLVAHALSPASGWLLTMPLLFLGDISFPLYLVHERLGFAVMDLARAAHVWPIAAMLLAAIAALAAATLIHYLIEKPGRTFIRDLGRRSAFDRRTLRA